MSYVIEARMDAIKRMSNEKRLAYECDIDYITEKIERFSRQMTPGQCADWSHILKFRQMELALDDLAVVTLAQVGTLDTKKLMDDALETIRLYHASCSMRYQQKQIFVPRRPDSPYVRTEIFTPCENWQPFHETGGAMLATLMRPDDKHVGIPMIIHAQEYPFDKGTGALAPADDEDLYA